MTRRDFLTTTGVLAAASAGAQAKPAPTKFQIACMTLPYSRFPLPRALQPASAASRLS